MVNMSMNNNCYNYRVCNWYPRQVVRALSSDRREAASPLIPPLHSLYIRQQMQLNCISENLNIFPGKDRLTAANNYNLCINTGDICSSQ